jgi:hypothetical protein
MRRSSQRAAIHGITQTHGVRGNSLGLRCLRHGGDLVHLRLLEGGRLQDEIQRKTVVRP